MLLMDCFSLQGDIDGKERDSYLQGLSERLPAPGNRLPSDRPEQGSAPTPDSKTGKEKSTLDRPSWSTFAGTDLVDAIRNRSSHRKFTDAPLTLPELSFLLWATQGIREVVHPGCAFRVVPSAGCRHAFETYLAVSNVEGLPPGIYRYLAVEHALVFEHEREHLQPELSRATLNQDFIATAPVTFIWAVIPYRMEWRYHTAAHRVIAIDAGHVCQNLYLACQAISAGACAIAAFHQDKMDQLLGVDGENEFTIYLAPVGKV